ncbi:MAG: hypothetical protein LAT62_01560 [Natronospirillum sp.]|uniref:hypothetical protein n=1 Tax=Natronospirillum sp. TaxID=2812955 RepID=UPI0025F104C2|nr:hypothetical protein [Natronospirillum sp.]MCH8550591.1 hypothetical protein [Natronospirillum sp.]
MTYPSLPVPELASVLDLLQRFRVRTYLSGYLNSAPDVEHRMPFVDICHDQAGKLQEDIPDGLRLVYPFPASSQACIDGKPDPLQSECRNLALELSRQRPQGYSEDLFEECFEGLVEQADYVLKFAPSRLVLVTQEVLSESEVECWLGQVR